MCHLNVAKADVVPDSSYFCRINLCLCRARELAFEAPRAGIVRRVFLKKILLESSSFCTENSVFSKVAKKICHRYVFKSLTNSKNHQLLFSAGVTRNTSMVLDRSAQTRRPSIC